MNHAFLFFILVLLLFTSFSSCSSEQPTPRRKHKYVEFYDLLMDVAKKMCNKLGPMVRHHQNTEFNWRTRCDLFYEALEHSTVAMGDTMVDELDITQKQLVDACLSPQNYYTLVTGIKTGIKQALTNPKSRIKEHDIALDVHRLLTQVVMSAATGDPGTYQELAKLPREAAKNAQAHGIRMPTYGITDLDELDEEMFLTGEDLQWAQTLKSAGFKEEEVDEEKEKLRLREKQLEEEDAEFSEEDDERLIDELSKEDWFLK
jgi:hypothetical protein